MEYLLIVNIWYSGGNISFILETIVGIMIVENLGNSYVMSLGIGEITNISYFNNTYKYIIVGSKDNNFVDIFPYSQYLIYWWSYIFDSRHFC